MIAAQIKTVVFKFVADQTTREIDLQNAAKSGSAMAVDVEGTNLYDVADKATWLSSGKLVSTLSGVSLYGPYPFYGVLFDPFSTNVTNPNTGEYYSFQPFADLRFRLAFADAVNMTEQYLTVDNKLGQVAPNVIPPGLPPTGTFNASAGPIYSYNPDKSASLLVDAMMHPLTSFRYTNGTAAPSGVFNNAFGCATLNSKNQCSSPIGQSIQLTYATGDTTDQQIFEAIAGTINNISATYNMGLTVSVVPIPSGQDLTYAFSVPNHLYFYSFGWIDDYPWVSDFIGNMLAYPGTYPAPDGWNLPAMNSLYHQAVLATSQNNLTGLIKVSNAMNASANKEVMYLWTYDSVNYFAMTSNVQGFFYNPSMSTAAANGVGPEYFATLY